MNKQWRNNSDNLISKLLWELASMKNWKMIMKPNLIPKKRRVRNLLICLSGCDVNLSSCQSMLPIVFLFLSFHRLSMGKTCELLKNSKFSLHQSLWALWACSERRISTWQIHCLGTLYILIQCQQQQRVKEFVRIRAKSDGKYLDSSMSAVSDNQIEERRKNRSISKHTNSHSKYLTFNIL